MRDVTRKIEVITHIAIIIVAVLLSIVLVKNYLLPRKDQTDESQPTIAAGERLSLPNVDWAGNRRTLIAVLSTNCRFCTESASLYQQIAAERAKRGDVRTIALFPQSVSDAQQYLSHLGVSVDEVRQIAPAAVNVRGTPTLILVDGTGTVKKVWVGKLPPQKEAEVLTELRSG